MGAYGFVEGAEVGNQKSDDRHHVSDIGQLKAEVGNQKSDDRHHVSDIGPLTSDFKLRQCLFGEHLLLTSPYKPVAIVKSEKTAIIASVLMPAFIWLACGSLQGLSVEKCRILQGRKVMLFPDVNACGKWKMRALELRRALRGTTFVVSQALELEATEYDRKNSVDVGDVVY